MVNAGNYAKLVVKVKEQRKLGEEEAEPEEHSDDSQRTIPYKPEDDEHPNAAEQPASVPVPVQRSFKRLLTDQTMKDSCSRFNKEMRKKRKPCTGK